MKIFTDVSKPLFERFQTENMDPALELIGDGLRKEGLRNQVCARLLGYRAFEAIRFDKQSKDHFDFSHTYAEGDSVDLTPIFQEVPSVDEQPYAKHADYLNQSKTLNTTLVATPLLLSILPVLLDDITPWMKNLQVVFDQGLDVHKPKFPGDNAPCYFESKDSFGNFPGYIQMLKLLSDTGAAPENLVGVSNKDNESMWINQHFKVSLEILNAAVKEAFDAHLARVDKIQREGYGESAPFKKAKAKSV